MKRFTTVAATLLLAAALPLSATAAQYTLTLSSWGSAKHPQVTQFVPLFVKLVEKNSHGRIKLRVFSSGELVKERFVTTAIPQGTVDISLASLDLLSALVPDAGVFGSPMWGWSMTKTRDDLVPGKPVFEYFQKELAAHNTMLLAGFDVGPTVLVTRFKLQKPSDMKGHTIRVYSKSTGDIIKALGGAPATIGVGEVYTALQRGTVDGAIGGLGGAVGLKYFEVGNYMFSPNGALGTAINGYVMNLKKFESLPPDLQKVIVNSANEARNHAQNYLINIYDKQLAYVRSKGKGVTKLKIGSPTWKAWRHAIEPLVAKDRAHYPAKLVDMLAGG